MKKHGIYSFGKDTSPVYCTECKVEIPPERIETYPGTTLCAGCQLASETNEPKSRENPKTESYCPWCAKKGIKSELVWRRPRDGTSNDEFLGCPQYGQTPFCSYTSKPKSKILDENQADEIIAKAKDKEILANIKIDLNVEQSIDVSNDAASEVISNFSKITNPQFEDKKTNDVIDGIEVWEIKDKNAYYVKLAKSQKERAKKITGYQWLHFQKWWKYPKSNQTYDAICKEFKNDAIKFDISPPD